LLASCGTDRSCTNLDPKSIPVTDNLIETQGLDMKVSPNPFQHSTMVAFSTERDGQASIKLVDFTGRLIKVLFNQGVEANTPYEVDIDGSLLHSGIYYCILTQSDGNIKVVKLIYKE
jgi:hypothetical protein